MNDSANGFDWMLGPMFGACDRPSVTAPKPPDSATFASRCQNGSPSNRPDDPMSVLKNDVSLTVARIPSPRSSDARKPNQEVERPPPLTTEMAAGSPAMRKRPVNASTTPVTVTLDWAAAEKVATQHAIPRNFLMVSSWLLRNELVGERMAGQAIAIAGAA